MITIGRGAPDDVQPFETELETGEGGAVFISVPAEVVAALGKGKRPPVSVTLNGYAYRSTVATYGGKHYLPVRREVREAAGIAPGQTIAVSISLDEQPRTIDVPEDLGCALAADPVAQDAFDHLSYSHRKEYVDWILGAKRPETRERRVVQTVPRLKGSVGWNLIGYSSSSYSSSQSSYCGGASPCTSTIRG